MQQLGEWGVDPKTLHTHPTGLLTQLMQALHQLTEPRFPCPLGSVSGQISHGKYLLCLRGSHASHWGRGRKMNEEEDKLKLQGVKMRGQEEAERPASLQWVFIKASGEGWWGMRAKLRDWLHHSSFDQQHKHEFRPACARAQLRFSSWMCLILALHASTEATSPNVFTCAGKKGPLSICLDVTFCHQQPWEGWQAGWRMEERWKAAKLWRSTLGELPGVWPAGTEPLRFWDQDLC